jgi:chemotaxis protein MotA
MADPVPTPPPVILDTTPDPVIDIQNPEVVFDPATVIGLGASLLLIFTAILLTGGGSGFFNIPSVMIVILGTMAVTAVSYTGDELEKTWDTIKHSVARHVTPADRMSTQILDLSMLARKKGVLLLSSHDEELKKEPFLRQAIQLVSDGFQAHDIEHFLQQDIETGLERNRKSAAILRRASEVAPGMGLIGTLIGLVQMLSQLENPSSIGPAMAIALLTTFYGAVMGTVVLAPLAAKVERNATEEALIKTLIMAGAASIARQENPRRLEIALNSILPASSRIKYFD